MYEDSSLDIFNELGFEADTVSMGGVEIPENYTDTSINELLDGDRFVGKPHLSDVMSFNVDEDGVEVTKYRVQLVLIDDEMEEALRININLKQDGDIQENIYSSSKLFALIEGLANLRMAGSMDNYNRIKKVDLNVIRKNLENIDTLKIEAVEKEFNSNFYNTFKVLMK